MFLRWLQIKLKSEAELKTFFHLVNNILAEHAALEQHVVKQFYTLAHLRRFWKGSNKSKKYFHPPAHFMG